MSGARMPSATMLAATETVLRMRDEPVPTWFSRVLAVWLLRAAMRRRLCACLAKGGDGVQRICCYPHVCSWLFVLRHGAVLSITELRTE
jgi:hypothetical protein